jgi:phage anti-repressor protein
MIEIKKWIKGSETVQAVDGRTLHKALGISRDFPTFITDRIKSYGYVESEDFTTCLIPRGTGVPAKEYLLSANMAAEICLLDRSDIGRELRRFILDSVQKGSSESENCTDKPMELLTLDDLESYAPDTTLKACLKCKTPFTGTGTLCQSCNNSAAAREQKAALVHERNSHKAPENLWVQCLIERDGDTTLCVPGSYGTMVTFRRNQYGHAVARVSNPVHRANILSSIFYKSYVSPEDSWTTR